MPDTSEGSHSDRTTARAAPRARPEILALIAETAARYAGHEALRATGLSASEWAALFQSNIEIESAYNPNALSHAGAIGLGQLMPDTARSLGVDPHDIAQNLDGSARYLLMRLGQFGSLELALAAYNAGAAAVIRHDGIPPYPETIGHVRKVMAVFDRLQGETL
nr:lytic transglycosylase domain-containing protein [Roseinatronobacter monicus]